MWFFAIGILFSGVLVVVCSIMEDRSLQRILDRKDENQLKKEINMGVVMRKFGTILWILLTMVLVIYFIRNEEINNTNKNKRKQLAKEAPSRDYSYLWNEDLKNVSSAEKVITRKDELILEAIINDFILRNKIKKSFQVHSDFKAYASIVPREIIIYVYSINLTNDQKNQLEKYMIEWINKTILDFEDFAWTKNYSLKIIFRDEEGG